MAWRHDTENADRTGRTWIFIAMHGSPDNEIRQARWVNDRWMTPAGNVSPRLVYAWTAHLEPPPEFDGDVTDADAASLV